LPDRVVPNKDQGSNWNIKRIKALSWIL
jgi:hypothetical protein